MKMKKDIKTISIQDYLNAGMYNRFNATRITFSTGSKRVKEVDLLYKQTTSNIIYRNFW